MPTGQEHLDAKLMYEQALEAKINPPAQQPDDEAEKIEGDKEKIETTDAAPAESDNVPVVAEESAAPEPAESEEAMEADDLKTEPTPWQNLDIKSMKVTDLRDELNARGLNAKGLKSQLVGRLQKALKDEQDSEENESPQEKEKEVIEKEESPEMVAEEEKEITEVTMDDDSSAEKAPPKKESKPVVKELDEKQKLALKNAYKFPSEPCILVHPHPKAKSGKFDCTVMSLSVLLDYRTEDNKEGTFEVSLFAELFNEMLMRDSGFKVYKAVVEAAEKSSDSGEKSASKSSEASGKEPEPEEEEKDDAKTKKKTITKNKDLLLACSYFDLGHCGYFETKDLEDILTTMNFNLSRAQIKKLVTKVTTGKDQQVNYRQFTDCLEDEEPVNAEADDEVLGQGFRAFLPGSKTTTNGDNALASSQTTDGICSYRGKRLLLK